MPSSYRLSRRAWLQAAAAVTTHSLWPAGAAGAADDTPGGLKICAFEKFVQDLPFAELADAMAEIGFDGIEATVRRGGHIEPAAATDELPRMVEALRNRGLHANIIATDVVRADDPQSEAVLRTAADQGIQFFRMGHYRYDQNGDLRRQMNEFGAAIRDVAVAAGELGVQALYQNHAGRQYFGATLWDLHEQIRDVPPSQLAIAYDLRHATVEAGLSWPLVYRLIKPKIGALFVKDFRWQGGQVVNTPLGEGRVDANFYRQIGRAGFAGPISLHVEYLRQADTATNLAALRRDLAVLRGWLAG